MSSSSWGLIGNERAVAALERELTAGQPAHAYLFVGPERVGKHTLAVKLAQALNCLGGEPPCDACEQCRRVREGIHADVMVVTVEERDDPEGGMQKGIHVSQVREVERFTSLKPFEGRCRVVIVDPAGEMNVAAQNAFLKTLEEPPPQVAFVLVTSDEARLLPTVRSRCRRIELTLPSIAAVEAGLLARGVEPDRARLLAKLSRGRAGWAIEAAADPSLLERREESLATARSLAAMSVADRFELAERMAQEYRRQPDPVLGELRAWRDWWRDVLLARAGAEEGVASVDRLEELRQDATRFRRKEIAAFVTALEEARGQLADNAQPRLVLEALLVTVPAQSKSAA